LILVAAGGIITLGTVGEQMLYEIDDPQNYILPDVVVDFTQVQVGFFLLKLPSNYRRSQLIRNMLENSKENKYEYF
jgi:hypothetical protein